MHINDLKKNFIVFPLTSHIVEHGTFNYIFENKYLKGFLKFNELLIGTYFRGVPIIGEDNIANDVEVILLEKDNDYINNHLHIFEKYNKEIVFFDSSGNLYFKKSRKHTDKQSIAFILFFDYYTLSRISMELANYHRVGYIPSARKDMQIEENLFDEVIYFDTDDKLYNYLDALNPKIIFTKALIGYYQRVAHLVNIYENVIVDSTDIPQFFHEDKSKRKFFFGGDEECIAVENIAKKAKKFLIRYSNEEFDYINKFSNSANIKTWYEYTNEEFYSYNNSDLNKKYSLVWAGILQPLSYPSSFVGRSLLDSAIDVSKQNIKFNFMLPPSFSSSMIMVESDRKLYYEFFYEARFNENVTIHFGDIPQRAIKLLENFDFGVFPLYQKSDRKFYKHIIPSKFALYLEAGLPMIVNESMADLANIVKKHKIGIVICNENVQNLRNIIDSYSKEYMQMKENIFEFRKTFNYKYKVKELIHELNVEE